MTLDELLDQVQFMSDRYAEQLDPEGDWGPMLFIFDGDKGLAVMMIEESIMTRDKDEFAEKILPNLVNEFSKKPEAIVLLTSAWMVKGDAVKEAYESGRSLSEHPDRLEVLTLFGAAPDGEQCRVAKIVRSDDSAPQLDWEEADADRFEGRMVGGVRRALWS